MIAGEYAAPEPAPGVRLVLHDGRRIPIGCSYHGWCEGADEWVAVMPRDVTISEVKMIAVDVPQGADRAVAPTTRVVLDAVR